jgi:hypothetical protein
MSLSRLCEIIRAILQRSFRLISHGSWYRITSPIDCGNGDATTLVGLTIWLLRWYETMTEKENSWIDQYRMIQVVFLFRFGLYTQTKILLGWSWHFSWAICILLSQRQTATD